MLLTHGATACKKVVADLLEVPYTTVWNIIRRYEDYEMGKPIVEKLGRPPIIGEHESLLLTVLALSGCICTDQRYTRELCEIRGVKVSKSAVQKHFKQKLGSKLKKAKLNEIDKFSFENWMKHQEYLGTMFGVRRDRFRFYDQTGINFSDLFGESERTIHGVQPFPSRRTPNGRHYSFFGMTGIRLEMPPMFFKSY